MQLGGGTAFASRSGDPRRTPTEAAPVTEQAVESLQSSTFYFIKGKRLQRLLPLQHSDTENHLSLHDPVQPEGCVTGLCLALLWQVPRIKEGEIARKVGISSWKLSRAKHKALTLNLREKRAIGKLLGVDPNFISMLVNVDCIKEPLKQFWAKATKQ